MKCTVIMNGKLSLIITAENELDKQVMQELFKSPVDTAIQDKLQIGDKQLIDNVVITPATKQGGGMNL